MSCLCIIQLLLNILYSSIAFNEEISASQVRLFPEVASICLVVLQCVPDRFKWHGNHNSGIGSNRSGAAPQPQPPTRPNTVVLKGIFLGKQKRLGQ
jgi:hypothetical protein